MPSHCAHRIVWSTVATVDRNGQPRTRILHSVWEWDGERLTGWIDPGLELTIDRVGDIETRRQAFVLDWGTEGSTDDLIGALGGAIEELTASNATLVGGVTTTRLQDQTRVRLGTGI